MSHKRITLLLTTLSAITATIITTNFPSVNDFVSGNFTLIMEATKMPPSTLIGALILLIGLFIYLWIDAGKKDSIDKLTDEVKNLINLIHQDTESRRNMNVTNQRDIIESKPKIHQTNKRHNH